LLVDYLQSAPQLYHPDRESAVWLYLRPKSGRRDLTQTLKVDPNEPDAALKGNQAATEIATGRDVHQEILTITTKLKVDPNEPDAALKGNQAATEIATGRDVHQEILTITTKLHQEEFDHRAIDRAEDEGMIVHPGQTNAPLREQEVAS
jgi:hypothetical protein